MMLFDYVSKTTYKMAASVMKATMDPDVDFFPLASQRPKLQPKPNQLGFIHKGKHVPMIHKEGYGLPPNATLCKVQQHVHRLTELWNE